MTLSQMQNSLGMWLVSGLMIVVMLVQAVVFFRMGRKRAMELGIPAKTIGEGARSAAISCIGPSLAVILILVSLIATMGTPTAWMRINDIGAGRTEIAVYALAESILPETAANYNEWTFSYALWGMALNNFGWMAVALIFTSRMDKINDAFSRRFKKATVAAVTSGALIGMFSYFVANNTVGKTSYHWVALVVSALMMTLLSKVFAKNRRIQEVSLGVAMIAGMFVAQAVRSITGG